MAVSRGDLGMLFGLAGLLLGGSAFYHSFRVQSRMRDVDLVLQSDDETMKTLSEEQSSFRTGLAEANKRISSHAKELSDGMNDVAGLRKRVDALERAAKDR